MTDSVTSVSNNIVPYDDIGTGIPNSTLNSNSVGDLNSQLETGNPRKSRQHRSRRPPRKPRNKSKNRAADGDTNKNEVGDTNSLEQGGSGGQIASIPTTTTNTPLPGSSSSGADQNSSLNALQQQHDKQDSSERRRRRGRRRGRGKGCGGGGGGAAPGNPNNTTSADDCDNNSIQSDKTKRRSNKGKEANVDGPKVNVPVGGGRFFNGSITLALDQNGKIASPATTSERSKLSQKPRKSSISSSSRTKSLMMQNADLMTKQTHQLKTSTYECMVCCDIVYPRQAVWSCNVCWAIFHLKCIKTWARTSAKVDNPSENNSDNGGGGDSVANGGGQQQWRCPGCQNKRLVIPREYFCFCGKTLDPEYLGRRQAQAPHACENICGKSRGEYCPHTCPLPCHPGPCPPCTALAPQQTCNCGKSQWRGRCSDYDPNNVSKSCGGICEKLLNCKKHRCDKICHPGDCQPCQIPETQTCYCGKKTREGTCGSGLTKSTWRIDVSASSDDSDNNATPSWSKYTGHYSCNNPCKATYKCGIHECGKPCHPHEQILSFVNCPLDHQEVKTCHCKKTLISDLGIQRESCSDPIPTCDKVCDKVLKGCLHQCQEHCHEGPCPPCPKFIDVKCRCGSSTKTVPCIEAQEAKVSFRCDISCNKIRVCGKHPCGVRCCPSQHIAAGDVVIPSPNVEPGQTDPHHCELVCGKRLRCGNHKCQMPCHRGHCPPCLEATFDEIVCSCGRTRVYPPIRCGDVLPKCRYSCTRTRGCGHTDRLSHDCHPDDVTCPPCTVLVSKTCRCGKHKVSNVPCYRNVPQCGDKCGKLLPCGGHYCQRICHSPDEPCLVANESSPDQEPKCPHKCNKPRSLCGHPCPLSCHAPSICDQNTKCQVVVTRSCECGRIRGDTICGATLLSPKSSQPQYFPCDAACKIAARNRSLASALQLDHRLDDPLDGVLGFDGDLLDFAYNNIKWVKQMENLALEFVANKKRMVLQFPTAKAPYRQFLHGLAEYYSCYSESVDPEPLRAVWWTKKWSGTATTAHVPLVTISEAAIKPHNYYRGGAIGSSSSSGGGGSGGNTLTQMSSNKPKLLPKQIVNAILLRDLRIGITHDELTSAISKILYAGSKGSYGISNFNLEWINEEDAIMWSKEYPSVMDIEKHVNQLRSWYKILNNALVFDGIAGELVTVLVEHPIIAWPSSIASHVKITIHNSPDLEKMSHHHQTMYKSEAALPASTAKPSIKKSVITSTDAAVVASLGESDVDGKFEAQSSSVPNIVDPGASIVGNADEDQVPDSWEEEQLT
ncbi:FKBP12-associated protein [Mycoemilia scoparia]|uniref:FKBP12-associated protein n=1 Tax=Mycoemilia scoparia TaxID=417184 RepID=A0A9W7ZSL6_9FUNG|nr:FKBP12-associated protein [Mycoemilia scoparia]